MQLIDLKMTVFLSYEPVTGSARLGRRDHQLQLPTSEVGMPDVADLSRPDSFIQKRERLLNRRQRIPTMHLVKIDPVDIQLLFVIDVASARRPDMRPSGV